MLSNRRQAVIALAVPIADLSVSLHSPTVMKIVLGILLGVIVLVRAAWIVFFPPDAFISFSRPDGGRVTFSRSGVSLNPAADRYATNGFDHIEPYVTRLLGPTRGFKFLHIFTPDGNRGFSFTARDGVVEVGLTTDWRQEAQREAAIRAFFRSRGIIPARDYLAGNGGVPDATRVLDYPAAGTVADVTTLAKHILQELCSVSPTEGLDITYGEK